MGDGFRYRLTYRKAGEAAYIGHLDLLRIFQRAIRMAELRPRYSEGFNPHLQISFAQPLSVGMEGHNELADIELWERADTAEIAERLSRCLPRGLSVASAEELKKGGKSAAALVKAAVYEIKIMCEHGADGLEGAAEKLMAGDSAIREMIYEMDVKGNIVRAKIACGGQKNLKPRTLAEELCAAAGAVLDPYGTEYTRRELIL